MSDVRGRAARDGESEHAAPFELTLFVSGASDLSARAVANARRLCDAHLRGVYRLMVIDIHGGGAAAHTHGVVATPTLVKHLPVPARRVVGDLSDPDRVLLALGLPGAAHVPVAHA
jgi:circadian clock protein KaiB